MTWNCTRSIWKRGWNVVIDANKEFLSLNLINTYSMTVNLRRIRLNSECATQPLFISTLLWIIPCPNPKHSYWTSNNKTSNWSWHGASVGKMIDFFIFFIFTMIYYKLRYGFYIIHIISLIVRLFLLASNPIYTLGYPVTCVTVKGFWFDFSILLWFCVNSNLIKYQPVH